MRELTVLDFLGGYHTLLEQEIHYLTATHQETQYLIEKSQKRILCQNAEIAKKGFNLPMEVGRSRPPESGMAPLASASNPQPHLLGLQRFE